MPLKEAFYSCLELTSLNVKLLPVEPWNFTVPLNAALIAAYKLGSATKIVFISVEMTVIVQELDRMLSLWETGESAIILFITSSLILCGEVRYPCRWESPRSSFLQSGRENQIGGGGVDRVNIPLEYIRYL